MSVHAVARNALHQLQREFPEDLRFVFRHFPLEEIHPHARAAATAAEAAGAQTDFWAMHEYLFEHQKALEDRDLHSYAIGLGLDPGRFEQERTSPEIARRIDRDLARAMPNPYIRLGSRQVARRRTG